VCSRFERAAFKAMVRKTVRVPDALRRAVPLRRAGTQIVAEIEIAEPGHETLRFQRDGVDVTAVIRLLAMHRAAIAEEALVGVGVQA